jgi:hypothetical protein
MPMEPFDISQVVQGDVVASGPMTVQRIIEHITANDAQNAPIRAKILGEAGNIETSGQELINAMATMGANKAAVMNAEQQTKLAQEKLVTERYKQIGIDMNNPANDRLAKMTAALQQQQDTALAHQRNIQQLDSVGFADNPIQWFLNQYKIDSEKESLTRTAGVANQLAGQLSQMHNLAQENVQSIVAAKLAKTDSEMMAAKQEMAALAMADLQKAKMETSGSHIRALSAVLSANEQEQSVMWKAAATIKDAQERERDSEKDKLQLEMLRLQLGKLGDEQADKKALIADMRKFAVDQLGAKKEQVMAMPNDGILNNKPLQEAYFASKGATGPQGPYSALNSIEANSTPDSVFQNTPAARWIRDKMATLGASKPVEVKGEKAERDYYDQALIAAAKAELAGDSDNSTLYRLPTVGELREMNVLKNNKLFQRYLGQAAATERRSFKQLIGYAVADKELAGNGPKQAQLVKDIVQLAVATNNYNYAYTFLEKYGLPAPQNSAAGGYKIAPKELLEAANDKLPESMKKRFFDLTKPGDVQLLINIATGGIKTQTGMQRLLGTDMGNELRAVDPLYQGNSQPPAKPKK